MAGEPGHKLEGVTELKSVDIGNSTFFCHKGLTDNLPLEGLCWVRVCYSVNTCFKERHTNTDHIKRFH